jgi:TRAP transporter TAXI family solute receptor
VATGSQGGVYYVYGEAIKKVVEERVPQLDASVLVTNASAENVRMIAAGEAEIGFTQADIAAEAVGSGNQVVALARLYDDYLHLVVRADSPIQSVQDLRGRRVSIGAPGSGTVGTVTRLLQVVGMNPQRDLAVHWLGLDDSAGAMRAGRIDAFFFSGGLPVRSVKELAGVLPLRLVDMGGHAAALRRQYGTYGQLYAEHAVPQSAYGLPPITTIAVPNYLVVSPGMPEATAYALTRALFTGRATLESEHPSGQRLNVRDAINTFPIPLHKGAMRWYRESKR